MYLHNVTSYRKIHPYQIQMELWNPSHIGFRFEFACTHSVKTQITSYSVSVARCVGEPAVVDGDFLWPGSVWCLALCVMEAVLGAMARPFLALQPEGAARWAAASADRGGTFGARVQRRFLQGHLCHTGAWVSHEDQPHITGHPTGGADQSQWAQPHAHCTCSEADHRPHFICPVSPCVTSLNWIEFNHL